MRQTYAVLPEKSVILSYGLSNNPKSESSMLMEYLQSHPVGVITEEIKPSRSLLKSKTKDEKHLEEACRKIDGLEAFLRTEKIPYSEVKEKKVQIVELLNELMKGKNRLLHPWSVDSLYKGLVSEIFSCQDAEENRQGITKKKIFYEPLESEDIDIIATGAILRENKYENMFIASFDRHMIDEMVSKSIREKLGVVCKTPRGVLSEIKLNLFR